MFGFWKRSKSSETDAFAWQMIKMIAVLYAPTLFFIYSPRLGIAYPWNALGTVVMLFTLIMAMVTDHVQALKKVTAGTPVKMVLFTSLTSQKTVDNSIIKRELIEQETNKVIEVKIGDKKEKIPMGRFVYLVKFIEPIHFEIGEKEISARKAIMVLPAPFEYTLMRFDEVELMVLRNIITTSAAWVAAEVIDYRDVEPLPVLMVVDSGFHNLLRRMKMELPEFTKKDILEGIRVAHTSKVIELTKELEMQTALIEGLLKTHAKVSRSAEMLARQIYEAQYTEMAPKVSIKSIDWKKALPIAAVVVIIILAILRFRIGPWW